MVPLMGKISLTICPNGVLEMEMCDKCGNVMLPARGKNGVFYRCSTCGSRKYKGNSATRFTTSVKNERLDVIESEEILLPEVEKLCPYCGFKTAWFWIQQSDEETLVQFFRCMRCRRVWREE